MYHVARAVGASAFLYMDTDAAPDWGIPPGARPPVLSLENFVNATETREGCALEQSRHHIYVSPSRGFWKAEVIKTKVYSKGDKFLNAGVMLVRTTDEAWAILKRWWWDSLAVHSPMETAGSFFKANFRNDQNAANFIIPTLHGVQILNLSNTEIQVLGVYNDSDLIDAYAKVCGASKTTATTCMSEIFWLDTTRAWPSDQERLQWLAAEDDRIAVPYDPALAHEDAFESHKVIYHWSKNKDIKSIMSKGWSAWFRNHTNNFNNPLWDNVTAWNLLLGLPSFSVSVQFTEALDTTEILKTCFEKGEGLEVWMAGS
jgi:hypothetical protein